VDVATFWDQVKHGLGLDEPGIAGAVVVAIQLLVVALATSWIAGLVSGRVRGSARSGRIPKDVASVISRAAALVVVAIGVAIGLALLGFDQTAVVAVVGTATVITSLAFQDVGRAFVNGVYILLERPYRIGDRIRIGTSEGRVEDIGVRLTRLRGEGGHRILVPNSVVLASVVENASSGALERQTYTARGIALPVAEIEGAVVEALRNAPHLGERPPRVGIIEARPDGTDADIFVEHDEGHRVDDQIIDRLRGIFPEATVSTRPPASDS
jgi:small-conductance mechanosensitive channel